MPNHHQTPHQQPGPAPTGRQQAYLRKLALERGVSFTPPATRAQASRMIDQLKARPAESASDRHRETRQVQADMATRRGGSARVREHELEGHGSTATWSERS